MEWRLTSRVSMDCQFSAIHILHKRIDIVGGRKPNDLTGYKFGRLTVIERSGTDKTHVAWLCQCDCGRRSVVRGSYLNQGLVRSCGKCGIKRAEPSTQQHENSSASLVRFISSIKRGDDPYQNLASAIVAVAVDDYRDAIRRGDGLAVNELESFFFSKFFKILSPIDSSRLVKMLKRELMENPRAVSV